MDLHRPSRKYLIGMHPDERGAVAGQQFVGEMLGKLEDPCGPIYMTDGYRVYTEALLVHLGEWPIAPYRGRGRPPVPKFRYLEGFNYGQVIKTRQGKKLEKVEYRIISGSVPDKWFNTSAVERMNLTIRNGMARLKRIPRTSPRSWGIGSSAATSPGRCTISADHIWDWDLAQRGSRRR